VPVKLEIARRKARGGTQSAEPSASTLASAGKVPQVSILDGDDRLGLVKMDMCFPHIVVSSTGLGVVVLDRLDEERAERANVFACTVVRRNGVISFRRDLRELCAPEESAQFVRSINFVNWFEGGWFDEDRKQFIIAIAARVASQDGDGPFRILELETGNVRPGTWEVVSIALTQKHSGDVALALNLAAEHAVPRAAGPSSVGQGVTTESSGSRIGCGSLWAFLRWNAVAFP
jgi:hypothetical protein